MLNPIPNVRGSGYDVIKKLRFRERKFALFFEHELPPLDYKQMNKIQRGPSACSPGFEDDDFWNSPCCWAITAVSYCPSRHLQLTEKT